MLDAFGADQGIGKCSDALGIAAHDQNFETIIMVEMNVQSRDDEVGMMVLQIGEHGLQTRLVMIEQKRDGARDLTTQTVPMFDQMSANHVANGKRAVGITLLRSHRIEFARQFRGQ